MSYNEKKAAQAVAYLLSRSTGGRAEALRLATWMYLAERECVRSAAWPLTDDRLLALPRGPALEQTLALLTGAATWPDAWGSLLARVGEDSIELATRSARLSVVDSLDRLSQAELEILDRVGMGFGHMTQAQLLEWVRHHCTEWSPAPDPAPDACLSPQIHISYAALARAVGYDAPAARAIAQAIEAQHRLTDALQGERA